MQKLNMWQLKGKPKFDRGRTPCGSCNAYNHSKCRRRLDGELCSCSCPQAEESRLMAAMLQARKSDLVETA